MICRLSSLDHRMSDQAMITLIECLGNLNPDVRRDAISALDKFGDHLKTTEVELIAERTLDKDINVKLTAVIVVCSLERPFNKKIFRSRTTCDPKRNIRVAAIEGIGKRIDDFGTRYRRSALRGLVDRLSDVDCWGKAGCG